MKREKEMDIRWFHQYNRLARRGFVDPLSCGHCGHDLVLRLTDEDEPGLECYHCLTEFVIRESLYERIRAIIKEFYPSRELGK